MDLQGIHISEIAEVIQVYSPKGERVNIQNRSHYGLSFGNSGKITYIQNGRCVVSDSTTAVLLPQGGRYTVWRQETGVFPLVNFSCDIPLGQTVTPFPIGDPDRMQEVFETLQTRFLQGDRLAAMAALYQLLSLLTEQTDKGPVAAAREYISRHIAEPTLNNATISRALRISTGCLDRRFLRYTGQTPKQYIIRYRMEKAKRLLAENRYGVGDICELCGYGSVYSFSRAFKHYTGLSPTAYKQKIDGALL